MIEFGNTLTQQPDKIEAENLKERLAHVSDAELSSSAESVEGINNKSIVVPEYFYRHVRYYHITDMELDALNLANWFSTGAFAFGSSVLVFLVDIVKDLILADDIPKETAETLWYFMPIGILICIFLLGGGFYSRRWRKNYIDLIKSQSRNADHLRIDAPPTVKK